MNQPDLGSPHESSTRDEQYLAENQKIVYNWIHAFVSEQRRAVERRPLVNIEDSALKDLHNYKTNIRENE